MMQKEVRVRAHVHVMKTRWNKNQMSDVRILAVHCVLKYLRRKKCIPKILFNEKSFDFFENLESRIPQDPHPTQAQIMRAPWSLMKILDAPSRLMFSSREVGSADFSLSLCFHIRDCLNSPYEIKIVYFCKFGRKSYETTLRHLSSLLH